MHKLPDVQNSKPDIMKKINRVGICNLKLPIFIKQKSGGVQHTVADIDCFVELGEELKGINMSRIPLALNKYVDMELDSKIMKDIAENIRIISEAEECQLIYTFPYFLKKLSPVNKEPGYVFYNITMDITKNTNHTHFMFSVETTGTSLCPCSKEMSVNNAHNQRSKIKITIEPTDWIWFEDVINIAESSCSSEIYAVLKRPDEKHVTDKMYNNPKFVEDIVREIYSKVIKLPISNYIIEVKNEESIHQHDAYAKIQGSCVKE